MESCTISKSNAIILSNNKQTVGIGAGQMNRVGAAKIALERAIEINDHVALVSDGFSYGRYS